MTNSEEVPYIGSNDVCIKRKMPLFDRRLIITVLEKKRGFGGSIEDKSTLESTQCVNYQGLNDIGEQNG
jgi:hypothetical protein